MSALNVFLAIMGAGVTAMVITGMVLLKQGHLVSPAPQTDLSDIEPHSLTRPNIIRRQRRSPVQNGLVESRPRQKPATSRVGLTEEDRPAGDGQTEKPRIEAL